MVNTTKRRLPWMTDELLEAARTRSRRQLMKDCGISEKRARLLCGFVKVDGPAQELGETETIGDDKMRVSGVTRCKNPDEFLAELGVDMALWEIERAKVKEWTSPMRLRRSTPSGRRHDIEVQQKQYLIEVRLRRRVPKTVAESTALLMKRLAGHAPRYKAKELRKPKGDHLCVLGLVDPHFGKLTANGGLKKARKLYVEAVEDLVAAARGRKIARFLLPVGNDFLHYDGLLKGVAPHTVSGTLVDGNPNWPLVLETAVEAAFFAVELAATIAPVDVVWVPGNHDRTTSYFVASKLEALFRQHPHVTVDLDELEHKYYEWGATLLGMTHGNQPKGRITRLGTLMAQDRREAWAAAICTEWLLGHEHARSVEDDTGVVLRRLPSLTANDRWHNFMGYRHVRSAEAIFYHRQLGLVGHEYAYPRGGRPLS